MIIPSVLKCLNFSSLVDRRQNSNLCFLTKLLNNVIDCPILSQINFKVSLHILETLLCFKFLLFI